MEEAPRTPEKRGKKRKASVVDVLVRDFADEWEKWDAYLQKEEIDVDGRGEVWEHLKGYRKKLETYPSKDRRKAYRSMYRRYKPQLLSATLSFATTAGSGGSPLVLPQLDTEAPAFPSLGGFDEQIEEELDNEGVLLSPDMGVGGGVPRYLTVHQRYTPATDRVSVANFENFTSCEKTDLLLIRNIIETDLNALCNTPGGGHIAIGIDPKTHVVRGYPLTRKIRDQIRLRIDDHTSSWNPVPTMTNLIDISFIEIRSHAKKAVQGHFVIWFHAKQAETPTKNGRGEVMKQIKFSTKLTRDVKTPPVKPKKG